MKQFIAIMAVAILTITACKKDENKSGPKDPASAERASIDRFSGNFATLFNRDSMPGLPAANAPINMDVAPFVTMGLGPNGEMVTYYNFDVLPTTPAHIYVFVMQGTDQVVPNQLNVVDVIPGDAGYNDFWLVTQVMVPSDYVANSITSYQEIISSNYTMVPTDMIVNCPIVPEGSTASL